MTQSADLPTSLVDFIIDFLDAKKAENIVTIDLQGKSSIADTMIIASGQSQRQVGAMAQGLYEELKTRFKHPITLEGMPHCDWVLLDTGSVIVHLFRPEVRAFYNLEAMWEIKPSAVLQARPQQ